MNREQGYSLLAVVGPTASGKSRLAVELAQALDGEVVSCDSMQIYRGMDIGTAKPTQADMRGVPHHLLDIAEPDQPFSCADYVQACERVIGEISARRRLPILCGGTGLYLERLLWGGTDERGAAPNPAVRQRWGEYAAEHGKGALHQRLAEVDPESAQAIHENNVSRVIRALEIYETTGMTKSEWDRRTRPSEPRYRATVIGLYFENRELLYSRINLRVEQMLASGLPEEARRLLEAGVFEKNGTAAQAIGYKELLPYLRGEETYEAAAEQLKQATRRYAKRQMTWFRARSGIHWIAADRLSEQELLHAALEAAEVIRQRQF